MIHGPDTKNDERTQTQKNSKHEKRSEDVIWRYLCEDKIHFLKTKITLNIFGLIF